MFRTIRGVILVVSACMSVLDCDIASYACEKAVLLVPHKIKAGEE